MTAPRIECVRPFCQEPATTGGIFTVQPNGMAPTHVTYYACDDHPGLLDGALETWSVTGIRTDGGAA